MLKQVQHDYLGHQCHPEPFAAQLLGDSLKMLHWSILPAYSRRSLPFAPLNQKLPTWAKSAEGQTRTA